MGDFCAPKRREVFDKIRRRLENYRQHQSDAASRFFEARPSILEQHKQSTLFLQQRWLESKAKKAAKQGKTSRDSNNSNNEHRNLVTKLKRKIDSVNTESHTLSTGPSNITSTAETVFNFDSNDLQLPNIQNNNTGNNKNTRTGNKLNSVMPSLSVQIVQHIRPHTQQDLPQTIHTNVTVNSCFKEDSPKQGTTSLSVQCKQEPSDDIVRTAITNASLSTAESNDLDTVFGDDLGIGLDDVDELQNFLDSIEKSEPFLLKELSKFDEICEKYHHDSESNESLSLYGSLSSRSPGLLKRHFPNVGSSGHLGSMFDNNQNVNATVLTNQTIPMPASVSEPTGPAAETLKQMAAQHQHQTSASYPVKNLDHCTDSLCTSGFSPSYTQMFPAMSSIPYNISSNHYTNQLSQIAPEIIDFVMFPGTKSFTHFSNEQGHQHNLPSSSSQQQSKMQNRLLPTINASHEVTQSQHMQLSQTQQVQMKPTAQQISLSQQQSVSMGQQQIVSEQIKIIEKMRMEHQPQGHMPPQYINRPPPDYNVHHNVQPPGSYSKTLSNNQNSLQNIFNQTSFFGAKSEVGSLLGHKSNGVISAMQQQTMITNKTSSGSHLVNLAPSNRSGYNYQQQLTQSSGYSSVEASSHGQSHTSSIIGKQRPLNAGVCSESSSITQSHTNTDWSWTGRSQSASTATRQSVTGNGLSLHGMTQSTALSTHLIQYQDKPLHYEACPNTGAMSETITNIVQAQPQTRSGQIREASCSGLMNANSELIIQHQMSQQLHTSNTSYNIGSPHSMPSTEYNIVEQTNLHSGKVLQLQTNDPQSTNFITQSTTMSNQNEFLHFHDNPLSNEPVFDSLHPSTTDDFSLFDDFLNAK